MPKVLIISYYWPPAGGGGVQRWLKFTKYLPEFGWHPVVYVPYNPQYPLVDMSLYETISPHVEVIKGHIWEARRVYRRLKKIRHGKKWNAAPEMDTLFFRTSKELSWFGRLSLFLRSNLFVPDSRSLWIRPSYRRLRKWLKTNPVDAIISTGPPHSCHLIALKLKKATGIPWIADFRDPWLEIDYFPQLMLTAYNRRKHERLQKQVLTHANKVITVSWSWADLFRNYGAGNVEVITNGFDESDIVQGTNGRQNAGTFVIANIGTLELDRNPRGLWKALQQLLAEQPELRSKIEIHLAGKIDGAIVAAAGPLSDIVKNHGYVRHEQAIELMQEADILLLPLNEISSANTQGRIPGKLFEYIAIGKPILMIGNADSDAGKIVLQLGNSWCVTNDDHESIYKILLDQITGSSTTPKSFDASRFERKMLTQDLVNALNELTSQKEAALQ